LCELARCIIYSRMSIPILTTKLYVPPLRSNIVQRQRLFDKLSNGFKTGRKLTLISAPAGFGKSTLMSAWLETNTIPIAWLSLDERDRDAACFISYLVAAMQTVKSGIGLSLQDILQSPQALQIENILILLINEMSTIKENFLVVLDDYHAVESPQVDQTLDFLIDHQPPKMHLVIITREDPDLPLARLRARNQLTELRATDLRFSPSEAAEFLNQVMDLNIPVEDVAALETRTEGWIAGLQMAAISLQGIQDTGSFIQSFTGSHRFVMDYLLGEVLQRQSENILVFLQKTSILNRMCGPLCDALLEDPSATGQSTLDYLDRVNLFIIPLDNERRWYRYHHLFASLLRKRLGQNLTTEEITRLNIHASEWYENNDMTLEAFRHASAANDIERAIRLMESKKMPVYLRGTVTTILDWLVTLPDSVLNAKPGLWWKQAELLVLKGEITGVEEKLEAAEAALATLAPSTGGLNSTSRDLIGKIAAIRSNLAVARHQAETVIIHAHQALEYLHPDNLPYRSSVIRDMGFAYNLMGNRAEAKRSFAKALSISRVSEDRVEPLLATIGLAQIHQQENQLHLADECYQQVLPTIGDYSILNAGVVYLGKARIYYEWNDLDTAKKYAEQSLQLAQQFSQIVHRIILSEVFLARLQLARGNVSSATALLSNAEQITRQHNLDNRISEITAIQVLILLRQGNLTAADQLTLQDDIPISRANVLLAQGNYTDALTLLECYRNQMEMKKWQDKRLKTIVLQAVAFHLSGDNNKALGYLREALALAEPNGFIRLFLDEGAPMAELLSIAAVQAIHWDYVTKLLNAFESETTGKQPRSSISGSRPSLLESPLVEPLSPREMEILHLLAKGLSNQQICQRLYLALDTVKGHNRKIFDKLNVKSRSEAVAHAREMGLL
jgi:LuxR family maltose regulon positive regulatory protein